MSNQKEPLVSIIIPVYNIAPYIMECVQSVRVQTYTNIEVIVVDDGSTDGTGEICEKIASYDDRIQVIHQRNRGVVSARGKGIDISSGEYILFIDGDDWVEPDMVEIMLKLAGKAELVTTKVYKEIAPNKWIEECNKFSEGLYSGEDVSKILGKMVYDFEKDSAQPFTPGMCNKLFLGDLTKKIYKELDTDITYGEDAVFVYKYLLQCSSIVVSEKGFYHYRYREGSACHTVDPYFLINVNKIYFALEEDFKKHKLRDSLILQLQKWIAQLACRAINEFMGFEQKVYIQEFIADLSDLENKRIILYGAGTVGQNVYRQLKKFGYTTVLWADKNSKLYQDMGMPVVLPDEILSQKYDVIFIAVSERNLAERIREELLEKGIDKRCILWREPMRVF